MSKSKKESALPPDDGRSLVYGGWAALEGNHRPDPGRVHWDKENAKFVANRDQQKRVEKRKPKL